MEDIEASLGKGAVERTVIIRGERRGLEMHHEESIHGDDVLVGEISSWIPSRNAVRKTYQQSC